MSEVLEVSIQDIDVYELHDTNNTREHVLEDLRPYVCTFPSCDQMMFPNRELWFNHELENHRVEHVCHFCLKCQDSAIAYEVHLLREHQSLLKNLDLSTFLGTSRQAVTTIRHSLCPFCDPEVKDENLPLDVSSFKIHVAAHMEQLALFALPRISDVGDESWESGKAALVTPDVSASTDAEDAIPFNEPDDLPIHHAAYEGRGVEIKRLLQDGQDIDVIGRTWGTALGAAILGKRPAAVKLLCDNGADIHLRCGTFNTALMAAAASNDPMIKRLLAEAEARTERPTLYGELKWKLEVIATRLETFCTVYTQNRWFLQGDGICDLEIIAQPDPVLMENIRLIGSSLDPESDIQATVLKDHIKCIPHIIGGFETLCDLIDLAFAKFKLDKTDPYAISIIDDWPTFHALSHFNDESLKIFRNAGWGNRFEKSLTEFVAENASDVINLLKRNIQRSALPYPCKVKVSIDCTKGTWLLHHLGRVNIPGQLREV